MRLHEALIHAVIIIAPLAIGAAHAPVIVGLCAAVTLAFILFLARGGGLPVWRPTRVLSYVLLAGGALMLAQVVPLPVSVAKALSPRAVEITAALKNHLGIDAPLTISLDPAATFLEVLKWCAGLMIFVMTAGLDAPGHHRILRTLAWAGFIVMLAGIFQRLLGLNEVLGFYRPIAAIRGFFTATFVNENHLAGYLGLASCVAFGIGLDARERPRRWLYLFIAVVTGAGVFLSLSRGGIVAFLAALFLLLLLLVSRRSDRLSGAAWWQGFAIVLIGLAAWLAYSEVAQELSTISSVHKIKADVKIRHFSDAARMVAAYWPVGAGRGAYVRAIDQFRAPGVYGAWTHTENEYLQIAADLGVPYALAFYGVLFAFCLRAFLSKRGDSLAAGLLAGVYMLALHNFVDFNLETVPVAFGMLAVLGVLGAGEGLANGAAARRQAPLYALLGLGAVAMTGAVVNVDRGVFKDAERVTAALNAGGYDAHAPVIARAIAAHRADYFIPHLAGVSLLNGSPPDPARGERFLRHAMYLNPAAFEPHLFMARLERWRGNPLGALAEYRETIRRYPPVVTDLLPEIDSNTPALGTLLLTVPDMSEPLRRLAEWLSSKGRLSDAVVVCRHLRALNPGDEEAVAALSRALTAANELDEAAAIAREVISANPGKTVGYKLLAGVEQKAGRAERALEWYEKAVQIDRADTDALTNLAYLHMARGNWVEARRAIRTILLMAGEGRGDRVQAHMMMAAIAEREGKFVEALSEYRHVRDLLPESASAIWGVARMHEALLEPQKAMETYRDLLRLNPGDTGARARLKALEERQKSDLEKAREKEYMNPNP